MRILCAPDSFKESMSAAQAADAMRAGIKAADSNIEVCCLPMADGGEGTTRAIVAARAGQLIPVETVDALGRPCTAEIGYLPQTRTAVVEVAQAIGLERIVPAQRRPLIAHSGGVGPLLKAAWEQGAQEIIVGLGGSATNDAGLGMLRSLGARFLDDGGRELTGGPEQLLQLAQVDLSGLDSRLQSTCLRVASDVSNPLLGQTGATAVFGPQKGVVPSTAPRLERALQRWADVVEAASGKQLRDLPGAGAAGGLGAAFTLLGGTLEPGVELVMDAVGLYDELQNADLVLTGEGRIDRQTTQGKTPWGVAKAAHQAGLYTILFGGQITQAGRELVGSHGIISVVAITPKMTLPQAALQSALENGPRNLAECTENQMRALLVNPGAQRARDSARIGT